MSIHEKLAAIQAKLHAPKDQKNEFGGYQYRSAEDILAAVKPLLGDCVLTITDDLRDMGGRVYVEAIAIISDGEHEVSTHAFARETIARKGMDDSQITGAASSYARKYALSGLFAIDNTPDADTKKPMNIAEQIQNCWTRDEMKELWRQLSLEDRKTHEDAFIDRTKEIEAES